MTDVKIEIPAAVDRIIKILQSHGFEGYAVGGCVRDTLLGRKPEDWDITTSATPWEVKTVFPRTIDTGIQHGTVTIMENRIGYEVTTYRVDGEYEDGRHPKSVAYTASLTEDLKRRDFTINAMAYSHEKGIVDEFGGIEDLKKKIIRCVGNPRDRFTEDALRILRAIRFSAQLGFEIEAATYDAIGEIAPNIAKVSKERIQAELSKLLLSGYPEKISLVYERNIGAYISERFQKVWEDREAAGEKEWFCKQREQGCGLEAKKHLRWAAFLRFSGEDGAVRVLRDLKLDNDTIFKVRTLVKWCYVPLKADKTAVRIMMSRMDGEAFDDLLALKKFIVMTDEKCKNGEKAEKRLSELAAVERLKEEIRQSGDCLYLKQLAVNGQDLIREGFRPGKEIGEILQKLLEDVLLSPEHNSKEYLLEQIKDIGEGSRKDQI